MTPFALMLTPQDADAILIIKFCKGVAEGSLEWLWKMCFLYQSDALAAGLSIVTAILLAAALRWFAGGR